MNSNTADWRVSSISTSSSTSSSIIWDLWTTAYPTATTTVNNTVTASSSTIWTGWIEDYNSVIIASAEDVRRLREAQQRNQAQRVQAEGERAAARERAKLLLNESLSEEQRAELADKGHFSFRSISKDGRVKHYRIKRGYMRNIHEIEPQSGRILNTICAHPQMRVPDEDAMLIQKLMLQDPESHDQFLKIANIQSH